MQLPMQGQNAALKRKAYLGIQSIPLSDSIKTSSGYSGKGLLLSTIKKEGTAALSGLKKDDILIRIGNKTIASSTDLKEVTNTYRSGDSASSKIWRDGKPEIIQIHFTGRPLEKSDSYEIIYDDYAYDEGQIRSIIYKPFGEGPFPTVFFIQGFGCYSVEMPEDHPYTQLFDALVRSGITVVKTEKPAMGDSEGYCDCTQNDLHYEIGAHKAGLHSLSNYNFIDSTQIFLWGHSLGGVIAPVLAQDYKPAGIAVYGL